MTTADRDPRRLAFAVLALITLTAGPVVAGGDDDPRAGRKIRAEPSLARKTLALPFSAVNLLVWPVKELVIFMEAVNLPGRVAHVARSGLGVSDEEDE